MSISTKIGTRIYEFETLEFLNRAKELFQYSEDQHHFENMMDDNNIEYYYDLWG
jgi:hypothetical protein